MHSRDSVGLIIKDSGVIPESDWSLWGPHLLQASDGVGVAFHQAAGRLGL